MNFLFTITAHGFEKAAKVEKMLKDLDIPFECKHQSGPTKTKRTRKVLGKAEVMAVITTIDMHPEWNDETVAQQSGVGRNTVNRIRRGIHPLCPKMHKTWPSKVVSEVKK